MISVLRYLHGCKYVHLSGNWVPLLHRSAVLGRIRYWLDKAV